MRLTQQSCRTTSAEFSLTGSHTDACATTQVYQIMHIKFVYSIVYLTYGHIFTFANQAVIVLAFRCNPGSHFTVTAYRRTFRLFRHHLLTSRTVLFHARTGKGFVHCNARLVDAKLLASQVCGPLRHQPVCHQLSARDSYESRNTIAHFVIQQHDAAADVTAGRVIIGSPQRANAGVCTQNTGCSQSRSQLLALRQQQIHLFRCNPHIIHLVKTHAAGSRSNQADCISRNKNICIGRFTTTVKHYIIDSMPKNQ